MEYIRDALAKAKLSGGRATIREHRDQPASLGATRLAAAESSPQWNPPQVVLMPSQLEENRIVSFAMKDAGHMAFNLLRTRVRRVLMDNGWKSVAVTSPPGCGKTIVALNLAFSLARASDCRVVLLDLDLKKSAIGRTLGVRARGSLAGYFEGSSAAEECFVQLAENLFVGLNDRPVKHSSEMMQSPKMAELIRSVSASLTPDILLFDLPPMRSSDDTLAFLPNVDSALLVIGAGKTTAGEVEESERQISNVEKLLGIVLNKCEGRVENEYAYGF